MTRLLVPALLGAVLASTSTADVTLVAPGAPPPVIVTFGDSETATAVAEELPSYLAAMTGVEATVAPSDAHLVLGPGAQVRVGLAADVLEAGPDDMAPESFRLLTNGNCLTVAGADEAGLWFGAYALLERLGCRFYFPGELGENVPRTDTLTLPDLDVTEAPDFIHRNVWWAYGGRPAWQTGLYADWRRKAKMGGVQASMGHNLYRIVPQAQSGETHPEYFPLIDGRRQVPPADLNHGWQPCTSNPEVVRLAIDAAIAHFDAHPDAYSFSLSPNDGYGWCECPDCTAQDPPEFRGQANRGKGRRTLIFANQVAEALAQKHPDKYVAWYAYAGAVEPPTDVQAHPNVVTVVAHYGWCGCNTHPIEEPDCALNTAFREIMDGWSKVADRIFIREYFATLVSPTDVIARVAGAYSLARDMPYFRAHNVIGVNSESVPDYGADALNYYLAGKLMWDADQPVEPLLQDWFDGLYGPAASAMREYTEAIVNLCRTRGHRGDFFTDEDLGALRARLDEAADLAETDKQKARVAMVREAFDYIGLMRDYSRKPMKDTREEIAALIASIEQGERLSIDVIRHRSAMGRAPTVSSKAAEEYAGMTLRPASPEPMPDDAREARTVARGTHGLAILLARGEKLTGEVSVRRLGRYLSQTAWVLLDPDGETVREGAASVEEAAALDYTAEQDGVHVLVMNSGSNACYATIDNQYVSLVGRNPHFLGATPWLYFHVPAGVEAAWLSLRTDAPGETGTLIVRGPDGKAVAEGETGEEQSKVTVDLPLDEHNTGKTWSFRITAASKGTCEDLMFSLGAGTGSTLATDPSRLLVEAE